jgi:hypothetical protein
MGAVSAMSYHFDISILHVVRKEADVGAAEA